MNRTEFMERLEKLLWNIPEGEREEALQYYSDYFDDAGPENEASVIRELGSPEQVAQKIKADFSDSASEYTERGYEDARFRESREMMKGSQSFNEQEEESGNNSRTAGQQSNGRANGAFTHQARPKERKSVNGWKILAIILLCILAAPVILPFGIAALAVVAGLLIAAAAVCFGIVVAGLAALVSGLLVIGVGIAKIFVTPAVGIAVAGVGFLIFALGILFTLAILWACIKIIPWLIRGIVNLIKRPFRKEGAQR